MQPLDILIAKRLPILRTLWHVKRDQHDRDGRQRTRRNAFFSSGGVPGGECTVNGKVAFVNPNEECINSIYTQKKSDIGILIYLPGFDFIRLTETFEESVYLSFTELKDTCCFVAPVKKLS